MGGGASKSSHWQRKFHLTSNVEYGEQYSQIFPVWSISITKNQRQLATATSNHRINLWCLVTSALLIPLKGHSDTIWCVQYSPDDSILASASADGTVRLWEVSTGLPIMILPRSHANWVWSLAWSPDGTMLATGGSDARIILWDAAEAAARAQRCTALRDNAAEDPDGEQGSWAMAANEEAEYAAQAARPLLYWQAHEKSINELCFAPTDARTLVSVGADGTLAIWDADSGKLDSRLIGHIGSITCVACSPLTEEIIVTGGEDHTVRLWDMKDLDPGSRLAQSSREKPFGHNLAHFTLKGHEAAISRVRFTPDGSIMASGAKDCEIRIWNPKMQGPTLIARFMAHEAWIRDLCWTQDQSMLYTASTDGLVFAWGVPKKYHAKGKNKPKGQAAYHA